MSRDRSSDRDNCRAGSRRQSETAPAQAGAVEEVAEVEATNQVSQAKRTPVSIAETRAGASHLLEPGLKQDRVSPGSG
jgi:hypothetical protein